MTTTSIPQDSPLNTHTRARTPTRSDEGSAQFSLNSRKGSKSSIYTDMYIYIEANACTYNSEFLHIQDSFSGLITERFQATDIRITFDTSFKPSQAHQEIIPETGGTLFLT